jgi:hypothetical protein
LLLDQQREEFVSRITSRIMRIFFFRSVLRLSKTNIGRVEFARPGKTCHLPPAVFFTQSIHSFCALKVQKVTWNQLTAVNLLGP